MDYVATHPVSGTAGGPPREGGGTVSQQGPPHGYPQTSRPWRPSRRGLGEKEASGHGEVGWMWRLLPVEQKPWQVRQGKQIWEQNLLEMPGAASWHIGAAQGPEGGPLVEEPVAG